MKTYIIASTTIAAIVSAGCASAPSMNTANPQWVAYSQNSLPDSIKVPPGHKVSGETVGAGTITYECRVSAATATTAAGHAWVFVGPDALLRDRKGALMGKYYGPPATWEANDGSKITGAQLAVAANKPGSIPLQLVKANPAVGQGAMSGVSYIQRVATEGGVAPSEPCQASTLGAKRIVNYQADYIFWSSL